MTYQKYDIWTEYEAANDSLSDLSYDLPNVRQIAQDTVLVHPAGAVQVGACPAAVLITDFQTVAALILQKSKGGICKC